MASLFDEPAEIRKFRLVEEGNWGSFRDAKSGFIGDGWSKKESDEKAHRMFPPGGGGDVAEEPGDVDFDASPADDLPELDLSDPDVRRDAYWCYSTIGVDGVVREQAPSQGAWNMREAFGKNPASVEDFYKSIVKPMLSTDSRGERYSDDGRELIALCGRYRAEKVAELAEESA